MARGISASLENRWAAVGMTGCGKTTWAKHLLRELQSFYPAARTYILDSLQKGDFDDVPGYVIERAEAPGALKAPGHTMIWKPPDDNLLEYDRWFRQILAARQPAIVFIDELASIVEGKLFPVGYARLLKQGRGLKISTISLTQEAAYIPRQTVGQVTHLIRFRLIDEYDQQNMDRKLGIPKAERHEPEHKYGFYYRRMDDGSPYRYYRSQEHFFGGK